MQTFIMGVVITIVTIASPTLALASKIIGNG